MIELLILFELSKKISTMYGISKAIKSDLAVLTTPSIGTIRPALTRLEQEGFIKSQKTISKGGRPSTFYSITDPGKIGLKAYMFMPLSDNPVQFLANARVRMFCADTLSMDDLFKLTGMLKQKAESLKIETEKLVKNREDDFYPRIVLDNLCCEYKNFISMLEGVERACKR